MPACATPLPPYVYLGDANHVGGPGFLGKAHEAYIPGSKAGGLGRAGRSTLERLTDRKALLRSFDALRADLDDGAAAGAGWTPSPTRRWRWSPATAPATPST